MPKLIDANTTDTLLETYDSVYIQGTIDGQLLVDYYLTEEFSFEKRADWYVYVTDDTAFFYQNGIFQKLIYVTPDGLYDYATYREEAFSQVLLDAESLVEKVASVTEAQGKLTMNTTMRRADLNKSLGKGTAKSYACAYLADAETYVLESINATITLKDGTTIEAGSLCSYNAEMPQEIAALQAYAQQTDDMRLVTLVFHAGTDQEKVEEILVPRGLALGLGQPKNATVGFGVYADAACTEPFQSNGDYESDITVYIK